MAEKFIATSNSAEMWIGLALEEAKRVIMDVPVGCIIVVNEEIIGAGRNVREDQNDPLGHAELIAIKEAARKTGNWRLEGATMYSTLEPCPMCAEAIIQTRISKLVFGAYDAKSGAAGSMVNLFRRGRIYPTPEVIGGIRETDCRRILIEHFNKHGSR